MTIIGELARHGVVGGRWRIWGILLAGVLAIAACTSALPSPAPEASNTLPVQSSTTVKVPFDFPVQLYQGEELLGAKELRFSKVFSLDRPVILNFFAGLCPPCRAEMPDLQDLSVQYEDRVTLLGLDIGPFVGLGSRNDGEELVEELGVTYPAGTTRESAVVRAYRILGMPTTVFLTPDGKVVRTWSGFLTRQKMTDLTEELLRASGRTKA